jgi:hypothetical protein
MRVLVLSLKNLLSFCLKNFGFVSGASGQPYLVSGHQCQGLLLGTPIQTQFPGVRTRVGFRLKIASYFFSPPIMFCPKRCLLLAASSCALTQISASFPSPRQGMCILFLLVLGLFLRLWISRVFSSKISFSG